MPGFAAVENIARDGEWLPLRRGKVLRFRAVRPFFELCGFRSYLFHEQNFLHLVNFLELHLDDLVVTRLDSAADKLCFNRQLAVSAIDEYQKLHARRPP